MTITVDGNSLDVLKVMEHLIVITGEYEGWKDGAFASTTKVYGTTREWKLDCEEYGSAWTGSIIEALQTIMEAKSTVTLVMTENPHDVSVSVKILGMSNTINTKKAGKKKYDIKLGEVA